ncbi:MAG: UDP-3-O-acyl-N-acetylglucosamine deacetylase [Planctomycetota bacterium]|nr:UDP-3-O-acyl-N-acetylglucosamine deacetylase [Planctomycetota bacterium]MDA0934197.1 UDP-3-O-acyl-N-acetylglucosamine deacetylase [Planctomycetota bacterium]MDA1222846.1 UDP-3-O-acyl-N-acetylglucosamine deacetylase [Planctomycetota bacterium]
MTRPQRTLAREIEFRGVGLHTGQEARMVLKPAEAGTGIEFVRTDLADEPTVRASGAYLKTRERRTCLHHGQAEVFTVEHLLAALYAMRIDNVEVHVDSEEMPGMDGSAKDFVEAILDAGAVEQRASRSVFRVEEPIYLREGDASIAVLPGEGGFTIDYNLDFPESVPVGGARRQAVSFHVTPEVFTEQIAPARTFVFEHEVEHLVAAGLGKGANYQNTLVMGSEGPKENALRWPDELARHKLLDVIGDLSLVGVDLDAHVIASRSGHSLNMKLVQRLVEEIEARENAGEFAHDSGLEIREILNLLPHRYPFLLIDRVIELDGFRRAVAIKNVSINEPFFQGHWPGQPIMPGVLQLEAMAQLAGVLLLRKLENTGKLAVLWSIDKVKLRGAVVPGDQLRIEVDTIRAKPTLGHVQARCKVGHKLMAEAQLKFTLIDA